jgi:hypothetical protein
MSLSTFTAAFSLGHEKEIQDEKGFLPFVVLVALDFLLELLPVLESVGGG